MTSTARWPTTTATSSIASARTWRFGLGYTKLKTNLNVFDPQQPLLFDLDTSGPELFFRVSF